METKLYTMQGSSTSSYSLNDEVFMQKAHPQTINDVVKAQLNNERQGNHSTQTRSDVRNAGRKVWRQKGTGRARQGRTNSPLWVGGGVAFGPHPRTYDHRPPRKVVDCALRGVLTEMAAEDRIKVVQDLEFASGKTKDVASFLKTMSLKKALLVVPKLDDMARRATANLRGVKLVTPMNVNVVDLLKFGSLAISEKALKELEEGLAK